MLPDRRDIASAPPMAVSGHVSAAADVHPVKTVLTPLSRVIVGPPALQQVPTMPAAPRTTSVEAVPQDLCDGHWIVTQREMPLFRVCNSPLSCPTNPIN